MLPARNFSGLRLAQGVIQSHVHQGSSAFHRVYTCPRVAHLASKMRQISGCLFRGIALQHGGGQAFTCLIGMPQMTQPARPSPVWMIQDSLTGCHGLAKTCYHVRISVKSPNLVDFDGAGLPSDMGTSRGYKRQA
jgi:hypothetical protein